MNADEHNWNRALNAPENARVPSRIKWRVEERRGMPARQSSRRKCVRSTGAVGARRRSSGGWLAASSSIQERSCWNVTFPSLPWLLRSKTQNAARSISVASKSANSFSNATRVAVSPAFDVRPYSPTNSGRFVSCARPSSAARQPGEAAVVKRPRHVPKVSALAQAAAPIASGAPAATGRRGM